MGAVSDRYSLGAAGKVATLTWLREATATDRVNMPVPGVRRMAAAEAGAYHVFGFGGSDGLAALDDLLLVLPNDPLLRTTVGASAAAEVRMIPEPSPTDYKVSESDTVGIVVGAVAGAVGFVLLVVGGAVAYRYCSVRRAKTAASDNVSNFYGGGDGEGHMGGSSEHFPYAAPGCGDNDYSYTAPDDGSNGAYRYTAPPDDAEMAAVQQAPPSRSSSPPRRGPIVIAACVPVQEE